jgi:L-ribulose-5-phosphate 4-epimerase
MLDQLKREVHNANVTLGKSGLITLTWGNVSGISRTEGKIVIKPSGVDYDKLTVDDMVVVDLKGNVVEGTYRPSSDTPTHLQLYKTFLTIGGIAHTHSVSATIFAQACKEIPCFGTTHADHFNGPVPVTRFLTEGEVNGDYEVSTGKIIAERFTSLDAESIPGVLVAGHAPFTWGRDASESVKNAIALENIAHMALGTLQLNLKASELPRYILKKHFNRKHGPDAYYGQKK